MRVVYNLTMRRFYTLIDYTTTFLMKMVEKSPAIIKWPILIPFITVCLLIAMIADSKNKGSGDVV
jgi:hypothetical protein